MKLTEQFSPDAPGIFAGLPMATYQAAPGLSKSRGDTLRRSPLDYQRTMAGTLKRDTTDALEYGSAFHGLLFEDKRDYVVRPETYEAPESAKKDAPLIQKPWNGNATTCKLWLASHAGQTILTRDEATELERSVSYIRGHLHAGPILRKRGLAELSFFARHPQFGFMLKGRADWLWLNEDGTVSIADLKTTIDATTREFAKGIYFRAYHVQAAMYRFILRQLGYELRDWVFLIFEKGRAPKCNVRRLSAQAFDKGDAELAEIFDLYRRCATANEWPEFADSEASIGFIDLPDFVYGRVDALAGMTPAEGEVAA